MITVQMEESDVLELFIQRIKYWTTDPVVANLYADRYERLLEDGYFDNAQLDIQSIVDNDYVNNCLILYPNDLDFDKYCKIYEERGACDISDEDLSYSYIESADDDDEPTAILVRR